jgi:hypothetical protein
MLIIRSEDIDYSRFSPSDFQNFMTEYVNWTKKLSTAEELIAGEKLTENLGKTLRKKGTSIVVDGPYSDSKDAIGGFYIVKARHEASAIEIANDCPSLKYGGSVEVREIELLNR